MPSFNQQTSIAINLGGNKTKDEKMVEMVPIVTTCARFLREFLDQPPHKLLAEPIKNLAELCRRFNSRYIWERESSDPSTFHLTVCGLDNLKFAGSRRDLDECCSNLLWKIFSIVRKPTLVTQRCQSSFLRDLINRELSQNDDQSTLVDRILRKDSDEKNPRNRLQECWQTADFHDCGQVPVFLKKEGTTFEVSRTFDGDEAIGEEITIVGRGSSEMAAARHFILQAFLLNHVLELAPYAMPAEPARGKQPPESPSADDCRHFLGIYSELRNFAELLKNPFETTARCYQQSRWGLRSTLRKHVSYTFNSTTPKQFKLIAPFPGNKAIVAVGLTREDALARMLLEAFVIASAPKLSIVKTDLSPVGVHLLNQILPM